MTDKGLGKLVTKLIVVLMTEHGLAYALISPDLRMIWASPNFKELLIDPPQRPEGRPLTDLFLEFVGAETELLRVLNGQAPVYRLERIHRQNPDFSTRYLNFLLLPLTNHQPEQGLLFIIEDETNTGQLEQQLVQERNELRLARAALAQANTELERLNRLKSIFLSISAHDLRAPLTAMGVYLDLILSEISSGESSDRADYLSIVGAQLDRLDRLVGDFLDLDTLEQGKLSIYPRACDLNSVVRQVAQVVEGWAHQQGLTLSLELMEEETRIEADPERLSQITYNLVSNAIKYTQEGGNIQISAWAEPSAGVLQIKDDGPGIPPNEIDHLFEIYYRGKGPGQNQWAGSGLGLYIVKSLVDAMHGQIEVSSELGRGTDILVRFPPARLVEK